jgi:hypothetical protein
MSNLCGYGSLAGDPYPHGYVYGMGVNPYPPVNMSDLTRLFFCRGYGYGIVIPDAYLPIAISSLGVKTRSLDGGIRFCKI